MDWVSDFGRCRLCLVDPNGLFLWLYAQRLADSLSQPIIAVQRDLPKALVPMGSTMIVFSQSFSASVFLAVGQAVFNTCLRSELVKLAPPIDVNALITVGATSIRGAVAPEQLSGVLDAYNFAVTRVFVSDFLLFIDYLG